MVSSRLRQQGLVLVAVLWMSALLIGFLALVSQNARTNARMAQALSATSLDDVTIQSAVALIKKGMLDLKKINGELDVVVARDRITALPDWPAALDFVLLPNRGKINLKYLSTAKMRRVLENMPEVDAAQIEPLIQAWIDWIDADDNEMPMGAERSYYEGEGLANRPANNFFQVPAELLYVRGFAEVFAGINVEQVFTVLGNHQGIDFSTASRDALSLIPGLDDESLEQILLARETRDLSSRAELSALLDATVFLEIRPWITVTSVENVFTIAVFERNQARRGYAYLEDIEINPQWSEVRVLSVRPLGRFTNRRI